MTGAYLNIVGKLLQIPYDPIDDYLHWDEQSVIQWLHGCGFSQIARLSDISVDMLAQIVRVMDSAFEPKATSPREVLDEMF